MHSNSATDLENALSYLEDRGFVNKQQNIRLLKRSSFNPEVVANFLSAKKALEVNTKVHLFTLFITPQESASTINTAPTSNSLVVACSKDSSTDSTLVEDKKTPLPKEEVLILEATNKHRLENRAKTQVES
jgi:uncharacterized protein YkwD